MITKEEIDRMQWMKEAIAKQMNASQEDVNFLIELKRKAAKIEQECIAVLEMIRRR